MIVTTADVIPGQAVQVLGLVRGNIVTSKNIGRDLMAGMKKYRRRRDCIVHANDR